MERLEIKKSQDEILIKRDHQLPRLKLLGLLTYGFVVYVFLGLFLYQASIRTIDQQVIGNLVLYTLGVSFFYYYGFSKHVFTDMIRITPKSIVRTRSPRFGFKDRVIPRELFQEASIKNGKGDGKDSVAFDIEVLSKDSGSYIPLISGLERHNAQAIKQALDNF